MSHFLDKRDRETEGDRHRETEGVRGRLTGSYTETYTEMGQMKRQTGKRKAIVVLPLLEFGRKYCSPEPKD